MLTELGEHAVHGLFPHCQDFCSCHQRRFSLADRLLRSARLNSPEFKYVCRGLTGAPPLRAWLKGSALGLFSHLYSYLLCICCSP